MDPDTRLTDEAAASFSHTDAAINPKDFVHEELIGLAIDVEQDGDIKGGCILQANVIRDIAHEIGCGRMQPNMFLPTPESGHGGIDDDYKKRQFYGFLRQKTCLSGDELEEIRQDLIEFVSDLLSQSEQVAATPQVEATATPLI